jgi:hypothetical protein
LVSRRWSRKDRYQRRFPSQICILLPHSQTLQTRGLLCRSSWHDLGRELESFHLILLFSYHRIWQTTQQTIHKTEMGQLFDLLGAAERPVNLDSFSFERYVCLFPYLVNVRFIYILFISSHRTMVIYKTAFYSLWVYWKGTSLDRSSHVFEPFL